MQRLTLNSNTTEPLNIQLTRQIRRQILAGKLTAGERLPASRKLADTLGIGRITVLSAYQRLQAEGFLETRTGSGTFVATTLPQQLTEPQQPDSLRLSQWGVAALAAEKRHFQPKTTPPITYDFGFGRTFPQTFPYDIWRKLLSRYLSTDDTLLARYGSAAGFAPLREAISAYVSRRRNVNCTPEQVIIVNGVQQAIDVVARLLVNPADNVLVESPGYTEAYELINVYGAHLHPLPLTRNGIQLNALNAAPHARLLFLTPTNQFPRGGALPLAGRLHVLQWANQHNAFILEDDYDSELYYAAEPPPALQSLDQHGRVIYLGTFSKVLFPALRLAHVILPPQLVPPFLAAKRLIDRGSPTLTQAAIADFIVEGHFELHMKRLRRIYAERRAALITALHKHVSGNFDYSDQPMGLHVMGYLPPTIDEKQLVKSLTDAGIFMLPGAPFHLQPDPSPSLLLGFNNIPVEQIEAGVALFGRILRTHLGQSQS
jgi:GntR family transcriptional regulator/MocR family aminotransferase